MSSTSLPHFDAATLERLLPIGPLVDQMEEAFRGSGVSAPRTHVDTGEVSALIMPAWDSSRHLGVKLMTLCGRNRSRGLPTLQGVYVLFDGSDGRPVATMDGRMLTLLRTSATSAMVSRLLSRETAETLLMVGAGALAPHLVRAHAVVRPIRRVLLWNRSADGSKQLCKLLEADFETVRVVTDLAKASGEADVISTATLSRSPLVFGRHLRPGTHLDLVGAFKPEMTEADPACFRGSFVAVDSREGATREAGDLIQAVEAGAFRFEDIACDLSELIRGSGPVPTAGSVTVFKSVGAALEDLAAALLATERASMGL